MREKLIYKIRVKKDGIEFTYRVKCYDLNYALGLVKNTLKENYEVKGVIIENYEK